MRFALVAVLLLSACSSGSGDDDDDVASPTPLDVTFSNGVMPVLAVDCALASCHDDVTMASDLALGGDSLIAADIYTNIYTGGMTELAGGPAVLDTANDAQSTLLTEPLEGSGVPHDGKQFPDVDDDGYRTLLGWIEAGALND